ncbi:RHS repeat-associated core domain-containing protein, partial [Chryseobacterium formosus]
SEGYFDFENNRYIYHYNDHLGNVRVSFARENNVAVVIKATDYYAFGLAYSNTRIDNTQRNYQYEYNGKELQEETGMYDYGARFYMPDLGRWGTTDPLAEAYSPFSPYAYVANNPINYYDPDGMQIEESSTGWTFTGSDINLLHSYLTSGTSMGSNYNNLMHQVNSFDFSGGSGSGGGGGISSFWSSFNGGNIFGGVSVGNNGALTWWTNGAAAYGNNIQGLDGHRMNLRNDSNWYANGGQANWFFASGAALTEASRGSFRLTNGAYNGSSFSPKYYQSAWTGGSRARITTYNISKIGSIAGKASFGTGVIMDGIGVYNYKNNPNSPNAVHPAKAGLNTAIGAIGVWGGPPGAIISTLYFGVDGFYPGGWNGALQMNGSLTQQNQAILGQGFNLYRDH